MTFNRKFILMVTVILTLMGIITGCTSTPAPTATVVPTATTTVAPTATATASAVPTATPTAKPTATTTAVPTPTSAGVNLNGAGATFPAPLYTKWFDVYNGLTGIKINYQAVGSGAGINQITAGTVDFGASDGIMTADQITAAEKAYGPILHIPMTSGAVVVIYNLSGVTNPLNLTGDVLANIYLKNITKWNDYRIAAANPGVTLPNTDIAVVHRSDGSGTTNIFTNYLAKVSSDWASKIGSANSVNWPGDIGGQGNAGVAGQVQQLPGAIGYVELAYAIQNKIPYANIKNAAGNFITPSLASTTKAADGVTIPDDTKVMLTNSSNPDAYPIVGFTWILVYTNQTDKAKGETLAKMLWWAIHDGQQYTNPLTYASLASSVVTKAENEILSMRYQGQPLITR